MSKKPNPVLISDFLWGIGIIVSTILGVSSVIVADKEDSVIFLVCGALAFLLTVFIGHNKKIKEKLDYE